MFVTGVTKVPSVVKLLNILHYMHVQYMHDKVHAVQEGLKTVISDLRKNRLN